MQYWPCFCLFNWANCCNSNAGWSEITAFVCLTGEMADCRSIICNAILALLLFV